MEKKITIGRTGISSLPLALGVMRMAGVSQAQADRVVMQAVDSGITLFDNADIYGGGILLAITGAIREGKAALSSPPRNCDIYDSKSCRMAYHMHGDGLMTMQAFADWIFATATEQKGGNDGK